MPTTAPCSLVCVIWLNKWWEYNVRNHKVRGRANVPTKNFFYHLLLTCYQLFGLPLVSLNFKEPVWPRECSWGLWPFCYFCCHALSDVCKWRTWPLSPVSPWHEKFRLTLLFKPFLMKSTQKWNWLMPNEYHWIAVIVRLMFVTLKLFIKHQFHFKSGHAMKCALTPLRILGGFARALSA